MNATPKREKYQRAARILAAEGWAKFRRGEVRPNCRVAGRRKRGQQHQPYACERADVFVKAQYQPGLSQPAYDANPALTDVHINAPTEYVLQVAYMTHCNCHPDITLDELRALMLEPRQT